MRFGKEFASKMIPEWQEAYIDYAHLKTILQDIQTSRNISVSNSRMKTSFARNPTKRYNRDASVSETHDTVVNTVEEPEITYDMAFLKAGEPGGDSELVFFRTLDQEFNKVNSFYRTEVEKATDEALALNKQIDSLVAFRLRVMEKKHSLSDSISVDVNAFTSEIGSSSKSKEHTNQSVLERIRMNKTRETPLSTIKTILKVHKHEEELRFTSENLKKAEELLQIAFIEFYQKLGHLKNYSFLNTSAISKIMKKYDKIAARNASRQYMGMVDSSYLTSSDEVHKLMLRIESTFIEHFSSSNRSQGMNLLRTKANKERHRITFSTGFFFGCSISLIIALVLIIHARNIMGTPGQRAYMETMFPLYRFFGFVVLHVIMYAANIYFWKIYRVNYSFIFGFKQGTELGYRHVLLLSFGLGTLSLCAVLLNLDMEMDSQTKDYKTFTKLIPLFLLALVIAITICPFNILYRPSRFFFLMALFHCIAAPFYTVNFPDFFLADQLTSQVQALRSLEFYICYYGFGDFRQRRRNTCRSNDLFTTFYFIVAVIPYWLRFLQCIRRVIEERDQMHGYNAVKYLLTIVAACLRTAYTLNRGASWNISAWVFSGAATLNATYWDIVVDWGLLQRRCKNSFLRDKLLVPHKTVYYAAMVLNVLLRLVWLQTVLDLKFSFLHRETLVALMACLEIIRRGIWNFFRLENEHLNNVGKFRAFRTVPLPFNYQEDRDQDS
ncbi:Phosphate transporter PHO1 4 [Hirschfeldia incana]|nr:Phosphate transporter PHO1 4 [Hirschfeldia incana]